MRIHEAANPFFNGEKYIHDFVDYWKEHYMAGITNAVNFSVNDDNFFNKFSITSTGGENFINTEWKVNIEDHTSTKFPFKMGRVKGMRLQMNNLATLENTPRYVETHFNIEKTGLNTGNSFLSSLEGCPGHAGQIALEVNTPVTNLRSGLSKPIDSIWINAPKILSFEGMNVIVHELAICLSFQSSISGIHKQLKNVKNLALSLPLNFASGLLGLALIPGLDKVSVSGGGDKFPYGKAINIIQLGKSQKKNVHDIQEDLLDAGLRAFATL